MSRSRYSPQQQAFYNWYLRSSQWRAVKKARTYMAGGRCEWQTLTSVVPEVRERCRRTNYLCVHHNTYERLGSEQPSDLDVYCWFHHMLEHLLWKKCVMCTEPSLENELVGAAWLEIILNSMGIALDTGRVNWKNLPNKEVLLDQVPPRCPRCSHYTSKD